MPPAKESSNPAVTEDEAVLQWRVAMFEAIGYPYPEALALALSDVDWHDCAHLIQTGCDPEVAVALLTP